MDANQNTTKKLCKALTKPFQLCWKNKSKSLLWVIYILLGGLLGVAINLINRWICGEMSFEQVLYVESIGGTFYTYAIVIISATIGPLFFNISESKTIHFADIKSFTITICIFVMVFSAIFYSNLEDNVSNQIDVTACNNLHIDWWQLIFFILSIVIALYSFGLEYLDKDWKQYPEIDSYSEYRESEEKSVDGLEISNPTSAGNGVEL